MRRRPRLFASIAAPIAASLFLSIAAACCCGEAPAQPAQLIESLERSAPATAAEYRAACRAIADPMLRKIYHDPRRWVDVHRKLHAAAHAGLANARLWRWTGEARYAEQAEACLAAVAAARDRTREADFFTVFPFAAALQILQADDRLRPDVARASREFIEKCFRRRDVGDHNQALVRACGLELAAQLYPDSSRAAEWHRYADDVWRFWIRQGDITENAPNYNRIDAVYVFLLGDLLGRTAEMQAPAVRAMFSRWRDQVAPSGAFPSYGDSGAGVDDPNWPLKNTWADWVAGFERAARFYQDGTFRWAADRLRRRGARSEPLGGHYDDILSLNSLMLAADWCDESLPLRAPPSGPLQQTRRDGAALRALDKVVLAPSRRVGAPFLLCDLYARGPHGHVNQHGGVNWLECRQTPLTFSLGYNNRAPQHTNLLLMRRQLGDFPHPAETFAANRWQTADLPTSRLPPVPGRPDHRRLSQIGLRVDSRQEITLWADHLRLAGPGGERLLEDFESAAGWSLSPVEDADATQGRRSLRWRLPPGVMIPWSRELNRRVGELEFDIRQYPRLRIDWKLSSNAEFARPFILRCGIDYHAHLLQLQPQLIDADVQSRGDDQYARFEYAEWFTPDTRHTRQLVLTAEGLLMAVDRVVPGAAADGQWCGPIWHLGPRRDPRRGPDWFHAAGAATELLVVFSSAAGRESGFQSADLWELPGQRTVYTREKLKARQAAAFVSLLLPLAPGADAAAIAEEARVAADGEQATAQVTHNGHRISIAVTPRGFSVRRDQSD